MGAAVHGLTNRERPLFVWSRDYSTVCIEFIRL